MVTRIGRLLNPVLFGYSQILFSESRSLGVAIFAASLINPFCGFVGFIGACLANFFAWVLGLDPVALRRGIFGCNGVLLGLAFGALFQFTVQSFVLLMCCSLLLVLLTATLSYMLGAYFSLPALSMPFSIVTWIAILASMNLGFLKPPILIAPVASFPVGMLPDFLAQFFSHVSAAVFQSNALPGLMIFVALLFHSRISILLMSVGLASAYGVHSFLGLRMSTMQSYSFPLSSMFAALAIGGIFTVTSPGSILLAGAGAALSVLFLSAFYAILPDYLMPLTLPYSLNVLLFLLGLRLRSRLSLGVRVVAQEPSYPEMNLRKSQEFLRSIAIQKMPIALPFNGEWTVTQAVDGKYTHQGLWRFAYDFQAKNFDGALFKNSGLLAEDYPSFGKPVLSPASGRVYSVETHLPDNPIGVVNVEQNWGNHLIIEHFPGWYSCLAHLKQGSVKVSPGEWIKGGQVIAFVGNSGRSSYPHLHLQFQTQPFVGAASYSFDFSNVIFSSGESQSFLRSGQLKEGYSVRNAEMMAVVHTLFPTTVDTEWHFQFNGRAESWKLTVDPNGVHCLTSDPIGTKLRFTLRNGVLMVLGLEGNSSTGLGLLGQFVAELPFLEENAEVTWNCQREWPSALDFLTALGFTFTDSTAYRMVSSNGGLSLQVELSKRLDFVGIRIPLTPSRVASVSFSPQNGIQIGGMGLPTLKQTQTNLSSVHLHD